MGTRHAMVDITEKGLNDPIVLGSHIAKLMQVVVDEVSEGNVTVSRPEVRTVDGQTKLIVEWTRTDKP